MTPYINASIIVQLLTVAIPALENLAKEADGQTKAAADQPVRRCRDRSDHEHWLLLRDPQYGCTEVYEWFAGIFGVFDLWSSSLLPAAGAQLIAWCGEQIDDKGIGNGISLLIFSSIVSNWSSALHHLSRVC